jgi:wyosine [tRNA(Phe)-imidazoG37] synthetase (radical SAM superfamily)
MTSIKNNQTQHVFGPVPSRRLGRSLGIDLVPFKTCSYDCIYCELGRTTCKTVKREEYVSLEEIKNEIAIKLNHGVNADYITLAGSGEPTLNTSISQLIKYLKNITQIPIAVLTNGSLLWKDEVKRGIQSADLVIPSLDANNSVNFNGANRPHKSITFDLMVKGLSQFSKEYKGLFYLEVFLLGGITAIETDVRQMVDIVHTIRTDKIQLNTVVRPPAEDFAYTVSISKMNRFAGYFGKNAEVIADYIDNPREKSFIASREDVLNLLKRRPCTIQDVSKGLSIHVNEVIKHINHLLQEDCIRMEKISNKKFYCVNEKQHCEL